MSTLKGLPPCPENLKPMLHYLKAAGEHDTRDPVVAYWLRFHAVQLGIRIDSKTVPAKKFIAVMDQLETTKKSLKGNEAITTDIVAQAHLENYAVKLFNWADEKDRAGNFDKNVIKAFYTAGLLFDCLTIWGEPSEEVSRQQKYAKWKAAYIHNCLKNGETPTPGPMQSPEDADEFGNVIQEPQPNHSDSTFPAAPISRNNGEYDGNTSNQFSNYSDTSPAFPSGHQTGYTPSAGGMSPMVPPSRSQTKFVPSPQPERKATSVSSPSGVPLSPDDLVKAQKYCKYAGSALQFDDTGTAIDLLEKTLRLLKTGRED